MSVKKSWDVQRRAPAAPPQAAPAAPTPAPTRVRVRPEKTAAPSRPRAVRRVPKRTASQPAGALGVRRKKKRRTMRYFLLALVLLLIAGAFYVLWMPSLRIQNVSVNGPDAQQVEPLVQSELAGTYLRIVPRNSVFFYPQAAIRGAILDAAPDISAVSFSRTSFSSIEVRTTARAESFVWCGTSIDMPYADGSCWSADIEGLIYAPSMEFSSTSTATGPVRIFSPLSAVLANGQVPIRMHIASPERIPDALTFVGAMKDLGAPVTALSIRGDEADLWIGTATRITYVLGREKDAATLAASALPTLHLSDGSIQYVDLRFAGKVYVKRYGE